MTEQNDQGNAPEPQRAHSKSESQKEDGTENGGNGGEKDREGAELDFVLLHSMQRWAIAEYFIPKAPCEPSVCSVVVRIAAS